MKKGLIIFLLGVIFITVSPPVLGLEGPRVATHQGTVSLSMVGNGGLILGGEYGLTSRLGITGRVGAGYSRIGFKFQLRPYLAVMVGATEDQYFFLGVIGSRYLADNLEGIAEATLIAETREIELEYQLGLHFEITESLELRGGAIRRGFGFPSLQLGGGYRF